MVDYLIKCHKQDGTTENRRANGYFSALETAKTMASQYQHCAVIYVDTPNGFKVKNTIAPDGRRIKNGKETKGANRNKD